VDKPLVILHGEIETPPFSVEARRWAGFLLRRLQQGRMLSMPDSRPMPGIGAHCHELRIHDAESRVTWRILYRIDPDAVLVADIFVKKTQRTPVEAIDRCQRRLRKYDEDRSQV
jgi:phage-related protein